MRMTRLLHLLPLGCALVAAPVQAELYKCVGRDGHLTYTSIAARGCKVLKLESSRPSAGTPSRPAAPAGTTPADFPRVDPATQRARDSDRRRILESELAAELKQLEQAQAAEQAALRAPQGQAGQSLAERRALHERNVAAIRREIANLR